MVPADSPGWLAPGGKRVTGGERARCSAPEAFCLSRAPVHPPLACTLIGCGAGPGRGGGGGTSGRGLVASAQDGGLGGAVLAVAERALARRAGAVREARDGASPGPRPGELDWGGPRVRRLLPGVPGGPLPPRGSGTQHLRVLNGTPPAFWVSSLLPRVGGACFPGLDA